jgi:hypothetical protein
LHTTPRPGTFRNLDRAAGSRGAARATTWGEKEMRFTFRLWLITGLFSLLACFVACDGADGNAILGTGGSGADPFAAGGFGPAQEGITLAADPESIVLDPCDPDAPTDPDTGKLLGTTTIGAILRDADLEPLVGVEVTFSTSAGMLESMGQPVLTDDQGLATDTLTVDEDDAGDVVVTVESGDLSSMLTVPVELLSRPPVTLEMQPAYLWPPNHKLREVTAVFDGIDCEPPPTIELVSVTSNEPDNDNGDGNTVNDIQGIEIGEADTHFLLRAERAGGGSGRIYTVTYRVIDAEGGMSMLSSTVTVPHDQGR